MGGINGKLQDLTNRLVDRARAYEMEVSTEKSKAMTNSTNNISADISMNGQKLVNDQFQVSGSNLKQGWHLLSRNSHQNCLSSNGQIKQDLVEQYHQLRKPCHLHPPLEPASSL